MWWGVGTWSPPLLVPVCVCTCPRSCPLAPARPPEFVPTCLHSYLPALVPARARTRLCLYLPACVLAHPHTCPCLYLCTCPRSSACSWAHSYLPVLILRGGKVVVVRVSYRYTAGRLVPHRTHTRINRTRCGYGCFATRK